MKYCRSYRKCDYERRRQKGGKYIIICQYRGYCIYQEEQEKGG